MKSRGASDVPGISPGFWFFPADFERDLSMLSLAAQGLWIRILGWMHFNESHRGFLELPTGEPMTEADIAAKVGKPLREVSAALREMNRVGVYSVDDRGCIYSRRMARETHISSVRREAAKARAKAAQRAANGSFAGDFAPANYQQNASKTPTVSDSDSDSDSSSKAQQPVPPFAPPKTEPPNPGKWSDPDPKQLAETLVTLILPHHPGLGGRQYAINAAERIIATATDPARTAELIRMAHEQSRPAWRLARERSPKFYIPRLDEWLASGDYLTPPAHASPGAAEVNGLSAKAQQRADRLRAKQGVSG